jgi:hypothetical protein
MIINFFYQPKKHNLTLKTTIKKQDKEKKLPANRKEKNRYIIAIGGHPNR